VQAVVAVRQFNRFYTRQIGLLNERLYDSAFSLSQVRVLYELAHRENVRASQLIEDLSLDPGYLSRMLAGFEKAGLLRKTAGKQDRRQLLLTLTEHGRAVFGQLEAASSRDISALLSNLSPSQQKILISAMSDIQRVLGDDAQCNSIYLLRTHQPGDLGWIVHHHGALYWQEYGYDERFEALVAEIVAHFVNNFDPKRERCWIAEKDGENVGCVMLVKKSKTIAKLRLLLVHPSARGIGIGKRLLDECINFARRSGYRKVVLWTQSELHSARRLYQAAGFRLIAKQTHNSWSREKLVAQTWELKL
jgi:DNA-binding MarR family transcriptional regulator/N-acetylglutamate synthase-like GNAT family acetyltransferase